MLSVPARILGNYLVLKCFINFFDIYHVTVEFWLVIYEVKIANNTDIGENEDVCVFVGIFSCVAFMELKHENYSDV